MKLINSLCCRMLPLCSYNFGYCNIGFQIGNVKKSSSFFYVRKVESSYERFLCFDMSKGAVRDKVLSAVNNEELDYIFTGTGEFMYI